jgi:hypothetical protein
VNELRQVGEGGAPQTDEMLSLHVPLRALAGDGGDSLRSVLRQRRDRIRGEEALVYRLVPPRHDADPVSVEVQRARDADRLRRHGVRARLVQHVAGGPDLHWNAQREISRSDPQRPKSRMLLGEPDRRDDPRRPRWSARVDVVVPFGELPCEVLFVDEAPLLEESALHPADEVFDRPLLLRAVRPAQLDAEPEIECDAGERWIPLGHVTLARPLQRDGLRPVEDGEERQATPRRAVVDHRADERLDALIGDQAHLYPAST